MRRGPTKSKQNGRSWWGQCAWRPQTTTAPTTALSQVLKASRFSSAQTRQHPEVLNALQKPNQGLLQQPWKAGNKCPQGNDRESRSLRRRSKGKSLGRKGRFKVCGRPGCPREITAKVRLADLGVLQKIIIKNKTLVTLKVRWRENEMNRGP